MRAAIILLLCEEAVDDLHQVRAGLTNVRAICSVLDVGFRLLYQLCIHQPLLDTILDALYAGAVFCALCDLL